MNKDVIYYPREAIARAVREFETPFFVYSEKRLRENCRRFKDAFSKHFPDFWPLFAVKANPNPDILRIIIDEGYDMDASSETEVWLSDKLSVTGMFTGNYTTAKTLKYAHDHGFILNLDDITNVPMLKETGIPEILSFRINPGIGKATIESNVFAGPDAKYGVPFEKAAAAYKAAQDMGVKRFGIHMMTGSNVPIEEEDYFSAIVKKLFEIVASIKEETGIEIELMNIGGGFGVPYEPDKESINIEKIAASVRETFDEQCEKYGLKEPRLMAEPGRFIAADAGWLVGKVTVIKEGYKKFIGLDCSTNDMPRPAFYDAYHYISVLNDSSETERVAVTGTICENNDQFTRDRELPKCSIGDTVIIHNSGGHARSMGHNYNGKLRSPEYLLTESGEFKRIRERETFEDLFRSTNL